MKYLPILAGVVVLVLVLGGWAIGGYNRVVTMEEGVDGAWAQVENQLQRRYDLIPNLVATVKGIAEQEKDVFIGVAEARNAFQKAGSVNEKVAASSMIERALGKLIAVREDYPELKSNESFLKLQDQLEGTENRVAVERGRYNDKAKEFNAYIRRFPSSLFAGFAGAQRKDYFELSNESAREAPDVDFNVGLIPFNVALDLNLVRR